MPEVRREHHVPQSYLVRFADKNGKTWVWDKQKTEPFSTNIKNVAVERDFYDTPEYLGQAWKKSIEVQVAELGKERYVKEFLDSIENPSVRKDVEREFGNGSDFIEVIISQLTDPKYLEKILSKHEDLAKNLIDDVLRAVEKKGFIKSEHKSNMAFLMAVQYARTKKYRKNLVEMTEGILNNLASDSPFSEENEDISVRLGEGGDAHLHIAHLLDVSVLDQLASAMANHICRIGLNTSKLPFYTSDQPVVLTNKIGDLGLAAYGIEIGFPLTPNYIFLLFEREAFKSWAKRDRRVLELKEEDVIYYNKLQVAESSKQVFCSKNSFSLIEKMRREKPHLFDPNRLQINIEEIGDDIIKTSPFRADLDL